MNVRIGVLCAVASAAVALLPSLSLAQWAKEIDGSRGDDAYSIVATSDGGYVLSGLTEPHLDGNADFWVVKLDADGETEWQKSYGGACSCEWAWSIQETSDGGFIVAGYTCSCTRSFDIWVLRLDADGDVVWQNVYGGEGADTAYVVRETVDAEGRANGYIVGGQTESFDVGERDILLLRLNLDGTVAWSKTYGGQNREYVGSVEQTADGGFIVGAMSSSFGRAADAWVLRLDDQGEVVWQAAYGGNGGESVSALQETKDAQGLPDGYIVAGDSSSFSADDDGDAWVIRLALDGGILWQKVYGGTWSGASDGIEQTVDGNGTPSGYVVSGSLVAIDGGVNSNGWLLRLAPNGALQWMSHYGGCAAAGMSAFERLRAVTRSGDGGFTAVGYSQAATPGSIDRNVLVLHVGEVGTIPYCGKVSDQSEMTVADTSATVLRTSLAPEVPALTWHSTSRSPHDTSGVTTTVCSGELTLAPHPDITVVPSHPLERLGNLVRLEGLPVAGELATDALTAYSWDLDGDGQFDDAFGPVITHAWTTLGVHEARLRVGMPSGKSRLSTVRVPVTGVAIDTVPGSCENVWKVEDAGLLPIAIRGSKYLDVGEIDIESLTLEGVPPQKWAYEDVSAEPKEGTACTDKAEDGIVDLVLLFDSRAVATALEFLKRRPIKPGESLILDVTGRLSTGATFHGQDRVTVAAPASPALPLLEKAPVASAMR